MIQITQEMIDEARDLIAFGSPQAVGYRLMVKPIEATTGLEVSEKEANPELAKLGFEVKMGSKEAVRQTTKELLSELD